MSKFFAIVKNELFRYFISPLAYVYLLAFLFLNASFTLYLGHFTERGEASLDIMFAYQPWIYLIFISGIAMRLWAEEFKSQTVIQIMSLPVSIRQLVWGKFTAAWIFCSFGLFLTLPFAITVNVLGAPDNGIILSSYFASFLLSGAMLAVAQMMSALTLSQVIALVLAVIVNLLFFLSGIEYVLSFFRTFLPYELVESIAGLSFLYHYGDMCTGIPGIRDVAFFISVIWLFNLLSEIVISIKTSGTAPIIGHNGKMAYILSALIVWLGFAGFNMAVGQLLPELRLDTTEDKAFTLPENAKSILQDIREPVTVKIYYSTILAQKNQLFRKAIDRINILMKQYRAIAGDKFNYRFYYPEPLNRAEDMALHDGLHPIPIQDSNQNAFFGITIVDEAGNQRVISYIPLENADKAGQYILQNIYELSQKKPTLGLITSLPLFGETQQKNQVGTSWEIINEISRLYNIKNIKQPNELQGIDVLLMIHPQNMSEDMIEKVATYTLNGGKILVLADTAAEAQRLYSSVNQQFSPTDIGMLYQLWGFQFDPGIIIADLQNSLTVKTGNKKYASFSQDVIQFKIQGDGINHNQPETALIKELLLSSATPINPIPNHNTTFIPLLTTSSNSALLPAYTVYKNMNPADVLAQFKSDNTAKIVAAKIISNNPEHPFKVIVIGDSDLAYDDFWSRFNSVEDYKYSIIVNDNANFILNALDTLSGQNKLISLRENHSVIKRFTKWEDMRKQNALKLSIEERKILAQINDTREKLNDLWRKKNFEERQDFSDDELETIAQYRKSLQDRKQNLANLKTYIDADIDRQKSIVVFFNLYAVPFLVILLAALKFYRKYPRITVKTKSHWQLNHTAKISALLCLLLFATGLTLSLNSSGSGNSFENRLVFPNWKEQLNNIYHIRLKHNNTTLHFYKKDGLWQVEGYEQYPLYQRRIVNLLASLANARYLERKSARAEYLPKFGLNAQQATTISLNNENDRNITQFDIGYYDEEVARGGRGAYLKFGNRFQVWLIEADFISLSTDWREWTLNTALNLRFGRLASSDLTQDTDILAILYKELLNTPLTIVENTDNLTETHKIWLTFENGDNFGISFAQDNDKYYLTYNFVEQPKENYLQLFAKYVTGKRYEIPQDNMEKINNVFESLKP